MTTKQVNDIISSVLMIIQESKYDGNKIEEILKQAGANDEVIEHCRIVISNHLKWEVKMYLDDGWQEPEDEDWGYDEDNYDSFLVERL